MGKEAYPVQGILIPHAAWKTEGEKGLTFRFDRDPETGYYLYETAKTFPRAVIYEGEMYVYTGWNSDTGEVCYKTGKKTALALELKRFDEDEYWLGHQRYTRAQLRNLGIPVPPEW